MTIIKKQKHKPHYKKRRTVLGRFIKEQYVPGVGVYAVFEDRRVLIESSPFRDHQKQKEKKNFKACSKFIDKIFREKRRQRRITKENILQHVA